MTTDRELLEFAAKAAGIPGIYADWWEMGDQHIVGIRDGNSFAAWNPLTDDGDALRLAVKLSIGLHPDPEVGEVSTSYMVGRCGYNTNEEYGPLRDGSAYDPYTATRRVIVRAAADIGESMP